MKKQNIIIILILIGIIITLIIIKFDNKNIVQQEIIKEQLGETTVDNAYIEMQTHLSEIKEQEEKLLSFKRALADYIESKNVARPESSSDASVYINSFEKVLNISLSPKRVYTNSNLADGTLSDTYIVEESGMYLITLTGSGNTCSQLDIVVTDTTNSYSIIYDDTIGSTTGVSSGKGANRNMIVYLSADTTIEMTITTRGYSSQFIAIAKL